MQVESADTLITAVSETRCLLSRDEYRMQLVSCHTGGRSAKSLEGIVLRREHVDLYSVVQCTLSAFEKQTNSYRKLLKSGKHLELFTVTELHNTHRSTFRQVSISIMLVWMIIISTLYVLYLDFVVRIS
jgi:hypothetical protein